MVPAGLSDELVASNLSPLQEQQKIRVGVRLKFAINYSSKPTTSWDH